MNERRVVITGIGTISPLGNDLNSTWKALKAGKSGIDYITQLDTTDYPVKIGGEVKDFDPKPFFKDPKDAQIALDCGYGDQSAFTRQFHATVGITPIAYRG